MIFPGAGHACVQCGFCCEMSECWHGGWDKVRHICAFLTDDKQCGKHDEIVEVERDWAEHMFGSGCEETTELFDEFDEKDWTAIGR